MTRLASHARRKAPSGIDRVELAYAGFALASGRCIGGIVVERLGGRWLSLADARDLLARARGYWRELDVSTSDAASSSEANAAEPSALALLRQRTDFARRLRSGSKVAASVYLRASHEQLDQLGWLARLPAMSKLFFIHDILPMQWPEYFVAGEAARHRRRLSVAARLGDALLVSSQTVAQDLRDSGFGDGPPIHVLPLGVEPAFSRAPGLEPERSGDPYFVMCGTLEPRKNHLLILNLWRELAHTRSNPPRLVIVGRRGWENEAIVDMLERCEALRPYVTEIPDLPTPALADLLRGACALLAPSFAEGYGIPVLEALAVGAAVIASDIPAHREIAGGYAKFLDPLDGLAWRAAVLDAAEGSRAKAPPSLARFEPPRWEQHTARLFDIIDALPHAQKQPGGVS